MVTKKVSKVLKSQLSSDRLWTDMGSDKKCSRLKQKVESKDLCEVSHTVPLQNITNSNPKIS